jgi:hypothetical protein
MPLYILFESAIGYGLFYLKEYDELSSTVAKVQKEIKTFQTFSSMLQLKVPIIQLRPSCPSSPPKRLLPSSTLLSLARRLSSWLISSQSSSPSRRRRQSSWASAKRIWPVPLMSYLKSRPPPRQSSTSSSEDSASISSTSSRARNSKISN